MYTSTIQLWDLPLRIFHWMLVATIICAFISSQQGEQWLQWHVHIGSWVICLLLFRIAWGFLGSHYSRFSSFPLSLASIRSHINGAWSAPGHSPLASIAVYAILLSLCAQSICGLFALNDEADVSGPFYILVNSSIADAMTSWHKQLFYLSASLIVLHVLAIAFYYFIKRQNLVTPMLTGIVSGRPFPQPQLEIKTNKQRLAACLSLALTAFYLIESDALLPHAREPSATTQQQTIDW